MKFLVSLLGLGTTVGGIFAGTLQQNLAQAEKPEIDILFEEIVKDMKEFSKENPMTKQDWIKVNMVNSQSEKNDQINEADDINKLPKYTFQSLTNIWMGLLSNYIPWWYDMSDRWGNSQQSNLKINKTFTEDNKKRAWDKAEEHVAKEKTELENEFEKKSEVKEKIEIIFKKIKGFIFLVPLPKNYNLSSNYENPYENYIKELIEITKF